MAETCNKLGKLIHFQSSSRNVNHGQVHDHANDTFIPLGSLIKRKYVNSMHLTLLKVFYKATNVIIQDSIRSPLPG